MMTAHIRTVAGHFAGKLYSWDVVNEVLDPGSHRSDGLRVSPWLLNCGANYIEQAFRTAEAGSKCSAGLERDLSRGVQRLRLRKEDGHACPA